MWVMGSKPHSQRFSEQSWDTGCGCLMAIRNCSSHQLLSVEGLLWGEAGHGSAIVNGVGGFFFF